MGLFSSKRKVQVASQIIHLAEDDRDVVKSAVTASALDGSNTTESILDTILNNFAVKARRAIRYAETYYTYGLPQGELEGGAVDDDAVQAVLETIEGTSVRLIYNVIDEANAELLARSWLYDNRGWNPITDTISNPPWTHDPLDDPISVTEINFSTSQNDRIFIQYEYTDFFSGENVIKTELVPFTFNIESRYYYVTYYTIDEFAQPSSPVKYWNYEINSSVYPTLTISAAENLAEPYYPIIPIRYNNQDLTREEVRGTNLFKTSEKFLDILGLNLIDIGTDVHANPDINHVDRAMIFFGIKIDATSPEEIRYLFEFFDYMRGYSVYSKLYYDNWFWTGQGHPPEMNTLIIDDADFRFKVTYHYIQKELKSGSIGPIGFVNKSSVVLPKLEIYQTYHNNDGEFSRLAFAVEQSRLVLRKQVTATQYEEITVLGPQCQNFVYGEPHSVFSDLGDTDNFILPLNRFVLDEIDLHTRNKIIYKSFVIVFNSYDVTRIKWYQSNFFKAVTIIVAVVITATMDWSGTIGATLIAATALTGVAAVIATVVVNFAISLLVTEALKIISRELGAETAMWVAVITAVVAVSQGALPGGVQGAPWATHMLSGSMALSNAVKANIQEEYEDLLSEVERFNREAKDQMAEIEEVQELLETQNIIDPFEFIATDVGFNPDESPEEFYNRTIHTGNIGVLGLEAIHQYVETQLTLPKPRFV